MDSKKTDFIQVDVSKEIVIKSLVWKFLERGGVQGIQFILQIILARLLFPEDYGVLAILSAFIAIANIFIQGGLNTALIQKKNSDEVDFSSVFWITIALSGFIYALLFLMAPLIAKFYNNEILTPVLRVLSITIFFGALNSIQYAMVSKTMQFRRFFYSSMGGVVGSGALGIVFAYLGYGVWALVIQQLSNSFLISIILWFTVKWRPRFLFNFSRLKALYSFGWKILVANFLSAAYMQCYSLIVGKFFSAIDLGLYSRGRQFPNVITNSIDGSIQSVMMPTFSAKNENTEELKRILRKSISYSCYLLFPVMFGMIATAKPLITVLLTEKWINCVIYLQLGCLYFAFWPIHSNNLTAINALGRSDISLKLEIIKKTLIIIEWIITIRFGLVVVAIGQVIETLISVFINAFPNKKLLNYSIKELLIDIFPSLLISFVMCCIVWCLHFFVLNNYLLLFLQIILGILSYIGLSKIFRLKCFQEIVLTLKNKIGKKHETIKENIETSD